MFRTEGTAKLQCCGRAGPWAGRPVRMPVRMPVLYRALGISEGGAGWVGSEHQATLL